MLDLVRWVRIVTTSPKGIRVRPWHRTKYGRGPGHLTRCGLYLAPKYRFGKTDNVDITTIIPSTDEARCVTCERVK